MKHLLTAAKASLAEKNWYSALTLALALPDICGCLDDPNKGSTARYIAWFNAVMAPRYTFTLYGGVVECFLNGNDCYALRCAFLHQGSLDITSQRVQDVLDAFVVITPPPNKNVIHMNKVDQRLQIQIDCFVEELCTGVEQWLATKAADAAFQTRMTALDRIYDASGGVKI